MRRDSLMRTGEFADLGIKCGPRMFAVHKVIICTQSPVLYAAIKHDFTVRLMLP